MVLNALFLWNQLSLLFEKSLIKITATKVVIYIRTIVYRE